MDMSIIKLKFGTSVLPLSITDTMTVGDAKGVLAQDHHLRVETVRLIVSGKVLEPTELLTTYKDSVITMVASSKDVKIEDDTPRHLRTRVVDDLTQAPKEYTEKPLSLSQSHFGTITTLPGLDMHDKAYNILLSLATDRGIVGIMKKYGWNVPILAEMYPEGEVGISEVCILGLNENKGQRILLRIRTDDLEGFRRYDNIRDVLIHELTHNVHSDHDSKFYMLMRQLKKESVALDPFGGKGRRTDGTSGKIDRYQGGGGNGSDKGEGEVKANVLDEGNSGVFRLLPANLMAGTAALTRLTREEQEVEDGCACGQTSHAPPPAEAEEAMELCLPCNEDMNQAEDEGKGEKVPMSTEQGEEKEAPESEAPASVMHIDGDTVRQAVVEMFDQAIAMNQEFLGSAYATEKLSMMMNLLLGLLAADDDNGKGGDTVQLFESARETLGLLIRILKGAKDSKAKRSLNKASKAIAKLSAIPGGFELLLCLGFTQTTEAEGKLVMRLFDESFNYISTSLLERASEVISEALIVAA